MRCREEGVQGAAPKTLCRLLGDIDFSLSNPTALLGDPSKGELEDAAAFQ